MMEREGIDFARLLGFATVSHEMAGNLDFRDAIGAKLGAKVGIEVESPVKLTGSLPKRPKTYRTGD